MYDLAESCHVPYYKVHVCRLIFYKFENYLNFVCASEKIN